jgi:hypothetical protein
MSIVFSSQANVPSNNVLGDLTSSLGIPGFPGSTKTNSPLLSDVTEIRDKAQSIVDRLLGGSAAGETSYVGSGRQVVVGGNIQGGRVSPLEEAEVREVYSQTPQASVIFKKRAFSSLIHMFNGSLIGDEEKWILRATKRLVERKCQALADYERLVKIEKMIDYGVTPAALLLSLVGDDQLSGEDATDEDKKQYSSTLLLQKLLALKQPVHTTTFFHDPTASSSDILEFGAGSGAFEITVMASLETSLDLDGNGSCSITIEDPYHILIVTEEDIESSIRETASTTQQQGTLNRSALTTYLGGAHSADADLSKMRARRGLSEITFSISLTGNGVSAILDAIGMELTSSNLDDVPENQTLDSNERLAFATVWSGLSAYASMLKLNAMQGQQASLDSTRDDVKYVRRQMRLYYLGKLLVQPMDSINVFIDGGTRRLGEGEESEDGGDITTLDGMIQTASGILSKGGSTDVPQQGPDKTMLWQEFKRIDNGTMTFEDFSILRTLEISSENCTHVFGGLVKTVSDSFDSGKYIVSVSSESNMEWLKKSRFNAQPALDQTTGIIFDPFTPFKFEVDPATGLPTGKPQLLDYNRKFLDNQKWNAYMNDGNRIIRGSKVSSEQQMLIDVRKSGERFVDVFQHVPGLKYRWKEGIVAVTYDMSTKSPIDGTKSDYRELRRELGPHMANTPFDNVDAANIISILVTGRPYNMATYILSALNNTTFTATNEGNNRRDWFSTFSEIHKQTVKTHGNFIPFKSLSVNPQDMALALGLQQQLTGVSARLSQLRADYARISDSIANYSGDTSSTGEMSGLIEKLKDKQTNITNQIGLAENEFANFESGATSLTDSVLQISGNDITFEFTDSEDYRNFGDKLLYATLRRREDVVLGRDSNYFIVSDEYDKDYDIQAFVLELRNQAPDLFNNSWLSSYSLCQTVAANLNFEFYCSSQGHIVFRPPQYNRTPASVLAAMLALNRSEGIQLFPDFLLKLFQARELSVMRDIVILECEIKMYAALLGKSTDSQVAGLVQSGGSVNSVYFLSFSADGQNSALPVAINKVIDADGAEIDNSTKRQIKEEIRKSSVTAQQNSHLISYFPATSLYQRQVSITGTLTGGSEAAKKYYEAARSRIAKLRGVPTAQVSGAYDNMRAGAARNGNSTPATDVSNYISKVASLVSRRSSLLRTLGKMLDQNIELKDASLSASKLTAGQALNITSLVPKDIYNRLIEDDTRDMVGHMSGARFIIRDSNIVRASYTEQPPSITTVQVTGSEPIMGKGSAENFGAPLHVAYATDFDTMRQYGWRQDKAIDAPFLWSASLQCAPYAVMTLSRERKNIIKGQVTVFGNEYYQLGDVVYVMDRQLLYYVNRVSHSFAFGGRFITTLDLTYGHAPGEYISTPMDVIGKMGIRSAGAQSAFRMRREKPPDDTVLGIVKFPKSGSTDMFGGQDAERNFTALKNAALAAQREIVNNSSSASESPRLYAITYAGDKSLQQTRANKVRAWFQNPTRPMDAGNGPGANGSGGLLSSVTSQLSESDSWSKGLTVSAAFVFAQHIPQDYSDIKKLTASELELLQKQGVCAGQEVMAAEFPPENIVELRLRTPPIGGWK